MMKSNLISCVILCIILSTTNASKYLRRLTVSSATGSDNSRNLYENEFDDYATGGDNSRNLYENFFEDEYALYDTNY